MTIETIAVNAGSIGFAVAVLLGILKAWIPGSGAQQDGAVRLLALALGIAGAVGNYLLNTTPATGPGVEGAAGVGFSAGVVAMGIYHTYNGDVAAILGSLTPTKTIAVGPVEPPAGV